MTKEIEQAIQILREHHTSVVIINNGKIYESEKRGILPLLDFLENPEIMKGASAADKVIGRAAAFLMIKGGIADLHAILTTDGAIELMKKAGVSFTYDKKVPYIKNRTETDMCPMEKCVLDVTDAEMAFMKLTKMVHSMK